MEDRRPVRQDKHDRSDRTDRPAPHDARADARGGGKSPDLLAAPRSAPSGDPAAPAASQGRADRDRGRLFTRGFAVIVAAQVFSLLGLEILQFVLPLYLLNLTGSGTLYGAVVAAGFVPYMLLAPIGGVVADRTRKRGMMAALDALLACAMAAYLVLAGSPYLVGATVAILIAAFAAQALYQPCVQSAIPRVVGAARVPQAVAVANQVSMVTGIGGPVIGGLVFGFCGLAPIVAVSAASFLVSSVLIVLFVRIPYEPPAVTAGPVATARADLAEALCFLRSRPVMWCTIAAATLVNLFASSFINIGTPYIVTEHLGLSNQLMGAAQGALAVGGLLGGMLVAVRPERFGIRTTPRLLLLAAGGLGAVTLVLALGLAPLVSFAAMLAGYLWTMACCMALSIALTSYLQMGLPGTLVGKVMALAMMFANLATPVGQLVYGVALDYVVPWVVALLAAAATTAVALLLEQAYRRRGVR